MVMIQLVHIEVRYYGYGTASVRYVGGVVVMVVILHVVVGCCGCAAAGVRTCRWYCGNGTAGTRNFLEVLW